MNKIIEFLQDPAGGLSSMRLGMMIWVVGTFLVWGILSYKKDSLQPIPESITAVLGIVVSGKVVQRFGEKDVTIVDTTIK